MRAIVTSGYADDDHITAVQSIRAGAFVDKPYTLDELARAVHRELHR